MKIAIAKHDEFAIGGGWSFIANFKKAMGAMITGYETADIYFIPSASMVSREEVKQAQADGKKIVLRVDNVVRNSRNRGTGMTRMLDFSQMADLVIFQSQFAEHLLNGYLKLENYKIILNSVDEDIFNNRGTADEGYNYLYCKYSSDETKNWEMARTAFQEIWSANDDLPLNFNIVGRFDQKIQEYNFDFFNGEQFTYHGLVTDKERMADIYRANDYFFYTYFNDACSNTAIEALMCGCEILGCYGMERTGGIGEIIDKFKRKGRKYFELKRMADEYKEALSVL